MGIIIDNGMSIDFHTEMKYHGKDIIIDAAYIDAEILEVMVMEKDNPANEYEVFTTREQQAAIDMFREYRYKYKDQPYKALTGDYAKLRDDLKALQKVAETADSPEDGGTCNFDAPSIEWNRANEKKMKQAAKEAGTGVFKWKLYGHTRWVFSVPGGGQANRRSRKAEAMTEYLKAKGYNAMTYCQAD